MVWSLLFNLFRCVLWLRMWSVLVNVSCDCQLKKMHNLKFESYIFIQQIFWGLQAQDTVSQIRLRNCPKEARGGAGYRGVFATNKRPGSRNIKRLLLIKENQISPIEEFSTFLCMGRCKSLGSLKSFLWYAPQLSRASILCFLIPSLLRVHCWGGCRSWLLDGGHSLFPSWVPLWLAIGAAVMWWLDGCNILCLLIWQIIF